MLLVVVWSPQSDKFVERRSGKGARVKHCAGGVWGFERGYCLMIGGEPEIMKSLDPIFSTLAPGIPSCIVVIIVSRFVEGYSPMARPSLAVRHEFRSSSMAF